MNWLVVTLLLSIAYALGYWVGRRRSDADCEMREYQEFQRIADGWRWKR